MNGYQLTRRWFNFSFEKTEAKAQHTAIYCWLVELNNRLGWKDEFTINTQFTMEGLSIGNKNTYLAALNDLEKWGFIKTVRPSINQNYGRVVTLRCGDIVTPGTTAAPTPMDMAVIQESDGNGEGGVPIVKPKTNEQLNHEPPNTKPTARPRRKVANFVPPTYDEVEAYFLQHGLGSDIAERCFFHYQNLDWHNKYGKKLSNWKSTMLNNWIHKNQNNDINHDVPPPSSQPVPRSRPLHESFTFTPNQ